VPQQVKNIAHAAQHGGAVQSCAHRGSSTRQWRVLSKQHSAELDRMLDEFDLDPPFEVRAYKSSVDGCPELPRSEPDCRQ